MFFLFSLFPLPTHAAGTIYRSSGFSSSYFKNQFKDVTGSADSPCVEVEKRTTTSPLVKLSSLKVEGSETPASDISYIQLHVMGKSFIRSATLALLLHESLSDQLYLVGLSGLRRKWWNQAGKLRNLSCSPLRGGLV